MKNDNTRYRITNPYAEVGDLLGNAENHYKTNLHTHSTYSDANDTMKDMIESFYDNDFDILAFAEHGILGKEWDKEPTHIPLYFFQTLLLRKKIHLTENEFGNVKNGTYKTKSGKRTKKRGLFPVPEAIEANMLTLVKNHVNGYFTDTACEGICGKENDYEEPVRKIEKSGGVSHINHPTDWLNARKHPDCTKKPQNVAIFANLLRKYKSCLGIEVLNMYDIPNFCDRKLWDELLKVIIPEGERSVWGFSNSDAHAVNQVDTSFMDFILPECSLKSIRNAMETGAFFAVSRYAKFELGDGFAGKGATPTVTKIKVDDENAAIEVRGINCNSIEWIADGNVIEEKVDFIGNECVSLIKLNEKSDSISCYVRFQLKGGGGITMSQPFICDDGEMKRFIMAQKPAKPLTKSEKLKKRFYNTRLGVILFREKAYEV